MSDYLKEVLASGRKLLTDTKSPKKTQVPESKPGKIPNPASGSEPERDPHKIFVKRAVKEKLKKHEIVSEVQKFCDDADSKL
jgi:hypothetical protein